MFKRALQYGSLFLFTLLITSYIMRLVPIGSFIFNYMFMPYGIPFLLCSLSFWYLNRKRYKPCWLLLIGFVVLSELLYQLTRRGELGLKRAVGRVIYEQALAGEITMGVELADWLVVVIMGAVITFLCAFMFFFTLKFSGKERFLWVKPSKKLIGAGVFTILFSMFASFAYKATIPTVGRTSHIIGDFASKTGYRFQSQADFLVLASPILAMFLVALWADRCLNKRDAQAATPSSG